jgi:cytochrome c oxidase assembly protein subunit 15
LIFVGGLVRVAGAGLGCPDWPKCFGRWIPPTDASQVPPEIDASLFNVTLAWIEYVNRLIGVVIGLLILATAVWALARFRRLPTLWVPAAAAALLVAFQGWLGSVVVSSLLEPWIVTVHLLLALVIVSLLVWVALEAHHREHPDDGRDAAYPRRTRTLLVALWVLALLQIGLGTQIRGALERLLDRFPLLPDAELLARVGAISHVHLVLGLLIAALTWTVGLRLFRRSERPSRLVLGGAAAAMTLVAVQLAIGFGFVFAGIPAMVQLFHSWVASLFVGALLVLYTASRKAAVS